MCAGSVNITPQTTCNDFSTHDRWIVSHTTTLRRSGKSTLAHSHRVWLTRKCYSRSAKRADDKVHALSELMFNYIFEKSGTYFSIRSEYVLRSTGSHIASNFYLLSINLHSIVNYPTCSARTSPSSILRHRPPVTLVISYLILSERSSDCQDKIR